MLDLVIVILVLGGAVAAVLASPMVGLIILVLALAMWADSRVSSEQAKTIDQIEDENARLDAYYKKKREEADSAIRVAAVSGTVVVLVLPFLLYYFRVS